MSRREASLAMWKRLTSRRNASTRLRPACFRAARGQSSIRDRFAVGRLLRSAQPLERYVAAREGKGVQFREEQPSSSATRGDRSWPCARRALRSRATRS